MLAIHFDARLTIGAVGYVASYLVGSAWPDVSLLALAAANLAMSTNAVWVYGPQSTAQRPVDP
jgi:hypothetical protein